MKSKNNLELGQIVKSLAGRDKDQVFVVVRIVNDDCVCIANGGNRRIEAPKRKKIKHLQKYNLVSDSINEMLVKDEKPDNAFIRKELSAYK